MSKAHDQSSQAANQITAFRAALPSTISLGLTRIQAAIASLPACANTTIITIAGTNGKGSVGKALSTLFTHAGMSVFWFNSPHLFCYQERFQLHNNPIDDAALEQAFSLCRNSALAQQLTIFEFDFLLAFSVIITQKPSVAVLEVGMGGRLDAVNAVDTDCAIISSIDLDHQAFLGNSHIEIAKQKAGILRPNKPAIISAQASFYLLQAIAGSQQEQAGLSIAGVDFTARVDGSCWHYSHLPYAARNNLPLPNLMVQNWALALAAFDLVSASIDCTLANDALRSLMHTTQLDGRFHCIAQAPYVICDVAANRQAIALLAHKLAHFCATHAIRRVHAVVGLLKDKAHPDLLTPLMPLVHQWHVVSVRCDEFANRSETAANTRTALDIEASVHDDVADCKWSLRNDLRLDTLVVCFGSFYLLPDCYHLFTNHASATTEQQARSH